MKQLFFTLLVASLFTSCTDAQQSKVLGFGNKFKIEVLSGGQIVRTYISTGKVITEKIQTGIISPIRQRVNLWKFPAKLSSLKLTDYGL